jgi:uncharacterized protein (TIGR02271 family)
MALAKIADLYPNYKDEIFNGEDLKDFSVYSYSDEKIGSVYDILIDDRDSFRYFVVDTGFWIFGKKVLLPVGRARVDYAQERVYAIGLTKEQAENLPKYDDDMVVDYDYEERVRNVYRRAPARGATTSTYDHNSYSYDNDAELYGLNNDYHGNLGQYQESLMRHRDRFHATRGAGLYKIGNLYPDYRNIFGDDDLMNYSFYSATDEKVGSVEDILVDRDGRIRYFVVDTGFWFFGKKVLLPVGRARLDRRQQRIYATGLTKEQAENLPKYDSDMVVDYDYEERVRNIYRTEPTSATTNNYSRDTYSYDREPDLYNVNENDHQKLKLYEERLVANKDRFRAGTVTVGKRVETEAAKVSVPVEKERIVVERHATTDSTPVEPGTVDFQEGEVARVEVYEETANIEKQAFVREEVSLRKEVERDTVSANETIRREELDIDTEGNPTINKQNM